MSAKRLAHLKFWWRLAKCFQQKKCQIRVTVHHFTIHIYLSITICPTSVQKAENSHQERGGRTGHQHSFAWSCPILCEPISCSTPSFSVLNHLPELAQTMSIVSVMPFNHLILWHALFLLPSIFPSIRVFSSESAHCIRWPKVLELQLQHQSFQYIQDQFPLGVTGVISLQSKGLSRVFSNTIVRSISSSALSLLYGPTLTSVHDYWKNYSFDYTDHRCQGDVSAF